MRRRDLASLAAAAGLVAGLGVTAGPAAAATPDCRSYQYVRTGTLTAGQSAMPWQYFFTTAPGTRQEICLDGPDGADVALVLTRLTPTTPQTPLGYVPVASAPGAGSDKTLTYSGPIDAYRIYLTAVNGGGKYTIGLNLS
ncbi:hypothetical protein Acy02nite_17210 [Actinoplanes cyaneus]|uniref:Uncharacterized protein n=1 Tax=Actinoplanes cyaneus TaxID=52696 RepID=A0A919ID32_9ACTN|nr:hypothetical protein [Actinoplanes cyaneus]MCW2142003.1 hypothetical protein [Actinoplanes cyaneus]GID63840.1 hypothetical protein Acy02nite_17210 [Actinoplanes cyaneus]